MKFDLDLPHLDDIGRHDNSPTPFAPIEQKESIAPSAHDASRPDDTHDEDHIPEETAQPAPAPTPVQPARPTMAIPDISLELDDRQAHPLQVRMDLAQELWDLGQLHTSRALMEEVLHEASGDMQAKAKQWLADRG